MTLTFLDDDVQPFTYPGGEVSVKQPGGTPGGEHRAILNGADPADLLRLVMWGRNVDRLGGWATAFIPYLPGARADHEEQPVGFDAAVYADLINSGKFEAVVCVDPHSVVMPAMIERCMEIPVAPIIEATIPAKVRERLVGVIIPDKGAKARSTAIADLLGLPTFQMGKTRDFTTGKLSGFEVIDELPTEGDFLVADDICDGGGTFAGLADAVYKVTPPTVNLHLWVTHGIFSGKAAANLSAYSYIMTTDSHPGHLNVPGAIVTPLRDHLVR